MRQAPGAGNVQPNSRWTPLAAAVVLLLLLPLASAAGTRNAQVTSRRGMVASAHTLASQAGIEMLKAGGNAIDAAVAAAFVIGVVEPNATGIGGEGMMVLYRAKTRKAVAIDYRSTAPSQARYTGSVPATGHAAVAVPGTVAGLAMALGKYGTLPLARVLAPAIRIAREGFLVTPTLNAAITDNFEEIVKHPSLAKILCPEGLPLDVGARLRNPDLAATLSLIAKGGADTFYRGPIAEKIVAEMQANGGFISRDDLAAYRAIERVPVEGMYRGHRLITAPPPVGGLAVAEILQILEQFDVAGIPQFSAAHVHLFTEAMRRGFADWSTFVGDPGFVDVPVASLLSPGYAKSRASEIKLDAITPKVSAGDPEKPTSPSTTSLSVVDAAGNMVALTQTISDFFGAKVVIEGTGIILNNEMKNFSARGANVMAPGKRMRTTIAPTLIVRDGKAFATIGTPGAARIISTMALLISNLVDYKMGIQEAIEAPRFFARDASGPEVAVDIEPRLPQETQAALTKMGYTLRPQREFDLFFGGAQGIIIDPKTRLRIGGADPRRDGAVIGY